MAISYFDKPTGTYFTETDLTQYSIGNPVVGACVITPTVKGKTLVPTYVTSIDQYYDFFGSSFKSGSDYYEYQGSLLAKSYFDNGGTSLLVVPVKSGSYAPATSSVLNTVSSGSVAFTIETLNDGSILNNSGGEIANSNGALINGTVDNVRWEVSNVSVAKGTFDLKVRQGSDNNKRKVVLESFFDLTLDPNSDNYISKVIGDVTYTYDPTEQYVQKVGSYDNKSKYIRISNVNTKTPDYFDNAGVAKTAYATSLPIVASGSFAGGSDGTLIHPQLFFENATSANTQGFNATCQGYLDALDLISDKNTYEFDLLYLPALTSNTHPIIISKAIDVCEQRGDSLAVLDAVGYNKTYQDAITEASGYDSSYGTFYFNHVQSYVPSLGKNVWTPPTIQVAGAYAYSAKANNLFFVPAGYNNALLGTVSQTKYHLKEDVKGLLEKGNVNMIGYHPRFKYVVLGQNTLSQKNSSLDRNNVRILVNSTKRQLVYISNKYLNELRSESTIFNFKNEVTTLLDKLVKQNGYSAYKITIDESAETIDRNELQVTIEIIPIKAIEKIVFNMILRPTGTVFA